MPQYTATIALSGLNGTNGFVLPGLATGDRTGNSVASAGDINGDGFDDFLVAASSSSTALSNAGVVYVVFGKGTAFDASFDFTLLDGSNGFRIDPVAANDEIGTSVSSAGDLNGDGFSDIIIGAAKADPGAETDAGSAYVIYGQAVFASATLAASSLNGANGVTIIGIDPGDLAGTSVGGGGDFNGDGLDDLLIGAPAANGGTGESYIIFGNNTFGLPPTGDPSTITGTGGNFAGVILAGGTVPSSSGTAIDFIGDINGDGFDDVIFGAPDTNANGFGSSGSSYVVFGSNSFAGTAILPGNLDGTNGFRIDGVVPFDDTGFSVASAGDINADGIADMIIGGPGSATGKAYVVFGRSTPYASVLDLTTLSAQQGFSINGLGGFDLFGESVSSAGDVNGDGYDDVIVGARAATSAGLATAGESYV
ncbi:MAG: integrin alpha, partial [Hyphomicrobium sp.]